MGVGAWDRPGPVAESGHVGLLPDTPSGRAVSDDEVRVRGERIGSWRVLCGTYVLQALSAVGLVVSLVWIVGIT
jgi:hypothetical protein